MGAVQARTGFELEHLSSSSALAGVLKRPGAVCVDVGGGQGQMAQHLAKTFPTARVFVEDINVDTSAHVGQVGFIAHDFFTEQPVKHADVYLLRNVLHNWRNEDVHRVFGALVPAMSPSSRIVVHDWCMAHPGSSKVNANGKAKR